MTGTGGADAPDVLLLADDERMRIIAHLRSALPNEGVGLIAVEIVERDGLRCAESRAFYPGTNFRASPVRYELDRYELVAALREIDARGWLLGAIVHSHPAGPATPSRTDLAEANYPESLMAIASFASEPPDFRAWKVEQGDGAALPRQVPIRDPSSNIPHQGIAVNDRYRE